MADRTIDITLSVFEQGGFYVGSGSTYSSTTEVRTLSSNKIAIPYMFSNGYIKTITVLCDNQWSFGGWNSSGSFVDMRSEALGYKDSGTIINISSYTSCRTLRIELHNDNGISPPQEAVLRVTYEDGATFELDATRGAIPIKALSMFTEGIVRPYPLSVWRIDENNGGLPYNEMLIGIKYYVAPPHDLPVSKQGEATVIDDTKSIEYKRYSTSGYTNPDLLRFQDKEFEEGDIQKIGIYGLNSYRYMEHQNYTEGSTTEEVP